MGRKSRVRCRDCGAARLLETVIDGRCFDCHAAMLEHERVAGYRRWCLATLGPILADLDGETQRRILRALAEGPRQTRRAA